MRNETQQNVTPIETREIRGLSIKGLITLIVCTISICGTVIGTYSSLNSKIDTLKIERQSEERITDLRIRTLETQLSALNTQVRQLEAQVNENGRLIQRNILQK